MKPLMENMSEQGRNLPLVPVVFFILFYFFLWRVVEPRYIYHYFEISRKTPFFKTGLLYLQNYLSYPSGLNQYLSGFLTQLCYFSWLGALCITLIALGIYRVVVSLTAVAKDSLWQVACYMPALLILMICCRYESPMRTAVAVLIASLFSVVYEKLSLRIGLSRVILFLMLSCILYYIVGSAALVFVALAVLGEFFNRGNIPVGIFYLLLGPAVCWLLGNYVFESGMGKVYLYSNPFITGEHNEDMERLARIFEGALFVILPATILLVSLSRRLAVIIEKSHPQKRHLQKKSTTVKETSDDFYQGELKWIIQISLLAFIVLPSVFFSFDLKAKNVIQVSYFTCKKMWPELLDVARKSPLKRYFPFCNHAVNRALYYTGRLGDEMFVYPQDIRAADLVFCQDGGGNVVYMERAESCLELGLVNVAEKIAHEFLVGSDDNPFILKQAALVNLIKGRIDTARVYLRALSKNLIYGGEARNILQRLEEDPQLEHDEQIKHLRSVMMNEDTAYNDYNQEDWLKKLLQINKHNKMAFEYLMADYLLTRKLDKFIENLPRLDDFDYEEIPRHYQEAILIYIGTTRKEVNLGARQINEEILRQYNEINEIGRRYGKENKAIWQGLLQRFNRTYFYYFTFGFSGMK